MKNKIEDLRNHLFATLEALLDESDPMDVGRAKAVAQVAQVLVNSAKAETEYLFKVGQQGERSPFMGAQEALPAQPRLVRGDKEAA